MLKNGSIAEKSTVSLALADERFGGSLPLSLTGLHGFEPSVLMMLLFQQEAAPFVIRGLAVDTCLLHFYLISLYDSIYLYKTECTSTITYFLLCLCVFFVIVCACTSYFTIIPVHRGSS